MIIPIIVKMIVSLAGIIILNSLIKNLTVSVLGGTLLLAFWLGLSTDMFITLAFDRIISLSNLLLLAIVSLVILLSSQMKKAGLIDELVTSIRGTFSPRLSMAVLPAVIGLLPMPGGALFSAPLLDNFNDLSGINQDLKTRINYWFRHVWEYAWPLYPGVILTSDISGIPLWVLFLAGIPVAFASITTGSFIFLSRVPKESTEEKKKRKAVSYFSIRPFIPIISVVAIYFALYFLVPAISGISQYLPMTISLILTIVMVNLLHPLKKADWKELLLSKKMFTMALLVLVIRVYGAVIESDIDGIRIVSLMTDELQNFGIPTLPLIILLPFISGMTMGISVGFVGAAMPVAVALAGVDASFGTLLSTVIIAYLGGFMGTMLSPLHVCLIVTCDYYESGFLKSLRSVLFPALVMISFGLLYMQLLSVIIP